jgi:hypothetical protein
MNRQPLKEGNAQVGTASMHSILSGFGMRSGPGTLYVPNEQLTQYDPQLHCVINTS